MPRKSASNFKFDESTIKNFKEQMTQEFDKIESDIENRLNEAALVVKQKSDEYVPEDTKRTKESWYQEIDNSGGQIKLTFGYDRNNQIDYLPLIYLNPDNMRFRKPGARSMWLHHAVADTKSQVDKIITAKSSQ